MDGRRKKKFNFVEDLTFNQDGRKLDYVGHYDYLGKVVVMLNGVAGKIYEVYGGLLLAREVEDWPM